VNQRWPPVRLALFMYPGATLNAIPIRAVSRLHGRLAVAGMAVAVVLAVDLHLQLSTQVSPIWQTLSEYVYGHLGTGTSAAPVFDAMCLALAFGSLALLVGIAKARRATPVLVLLGLWCAGLFVVAIFPVDPPGAVRSFSGQVHNYGAVLAFIALPAAGWLLTRRSSTQCPWEPRRTTIRRLAVASAISLVVVLGSFVWITSTSPAHPEVALGLFERTLFTIDLALLTTMVRPLLSERRGDAIASRVPRRAVSAAQR
jgi:hypothetical protein